MGTYQVPRNVKGEGRILFIFSKKAIIYTIIGIGIGLIFGLIFTIVQLQVVGYVIMGLFGAIGFIIGTFKMPNTTAFEITKKTGGENIDDVIKRAIKFKKKGNKIYVYEEAEKLKGDIEKEKNKEEN